VDDGDWGDQAARMRIVRRRVRTGLSNNLTNEFTERDENALRVPRSPLEAAWMDREQKHLTAEDAARVQGSRFGVAQWRRNRRCR
jgi:hypothetical protein